MKERKSWQGNPQPKDQILKARSQGWKIVCNHFWITLSMCNMKQSNRKALTNNLEPIKIGYFSGTAELGLPGVQVQSPVFGGGRTKVFPKFYRFTWVLSIVHPPDFSPSHRPCFFVLNLFVPIGTKSKLYFPKWSASYVCQKLISSTNQHTYSEKSRFTNTWFDCIYYFNWIRFNWDMIIERYSVLENESILEIQGRKTVSL